MRRRLPSLNALRAFEAAARHSSFTKAAEELFVTHAAISRQVRELEKYLGLKLFVRQGQGVTPTDVGAAYQRRLTPLFDEMHAATAEARAGDHQPLTVRVDQAFATHWLVPRLKSFREQYPDIELVLDASYQTFDPQTTAAEVAVHYADDPGEFVNVQVEQLIELNAFAVCSPDFFETHPITQPSDLLSYPLLHEESRSWWAEWMHLVDRDVPSPEKGYLFDETHLAMVAAESGQGVALADDITAHDALKTGRLVRALPHTAPGGGYYFLSRPSQNLSQAALDFRYWLREELAITRSETS